MHISLRRVAWIKAEREWQELKWAEGQDRLEALAEERRKRQENQFDAEASAASPACYLASPLII
jgi:hypothetical protein